MKKVEKNKVRFITESQLLAFFMQFIGSAFLQINSLTFPRVNKSSRITGEPTPFAVLSHAKNFNAQIGYEYEKRVNTQCEREGLDPKFVAQAHPWAEHMEGAVFCRKRDGQGRYVAYIQQRIDADDYFMDGENVEISTLSEFLPPKRNYDSQPTEKKVPVQFVKVENIMSFTHGKTDYFVIR